MFKNNDDVIVKRKNFTDAIWWKAVIVKIFEPNELQDGVYETQYLLKDKDNGIALRLLESEIDILKDTK